MLKARVLLAILVLSLFAVSAGYALEFTNKAEIVSIKGDVKVLPKDKNDWISAGVSMVLRSGDKVRTGAGALCNIAFESELKNVVGIRENSEVVILLAKNDKIELIDASIYARLKAVPKGSMFQVRTPNAVCGVRGTGLGIDADGNGTEASAYENTVYVGNGSGQEEDIDEGFKRNVDGNGNISDEEKLGDEEKDDFGQWEKDMDDQGDSYDKSDREKMVNLDSDSTDYIDKLTDTSFEDEDRISEKNVDAKEDIQQREEESNEDEQGPSIGY